MNYKKSKFLLFPAMLSTVALGVGTLVPAHGATEPESESVQVVASAAIAETTEEDPTIGEVSLTENDAANLEALEKHIDATGDLDVESAASDPQVDDQFLDEFAEGYALAVNHGSTNAGGTSGAQTRSAASTTSSCAGINGHAGQQVFLDSCNASALSSAMGSAASVATLTAIITAASGVGLVVAGSIAAGLGLATGLTSLCNSWGRGIFINVGAPPLCWSQP